MVDLNSQILIILLIIDLSVRSSKINVCYHEQFKRLTIMLSKTSPSVESADLVRALSLLNDVYDALQKNQYPDEAIMVSNHLKQLSSPSIASAVLLEGIDPILDKMAKEFAEDSVAA